MDGLLAVGLFLVAVFAWRSVLVKHGNLEFWQVAANQPNAALEWLKGRTDWIVLPSGDPQIEQLRHSPDLAGPFRLTVPSEEGVFVLFAERESMDTSREEFMEFFGARQERSRLPWISMVALLYPISAMLAIAARGAPLLPTLGYGFAQLAYVLLAAGILSGRFGALGLKFRGPTLISAAAIWLIGTLLGNR